MLTESQVLEVESSGACSRQGRRCLGCRVPLQCVIPAIALSEEVGVEYDLHIPFTVESLVLEADQIDFYESEIEFYRILNTDRAGLEKDLNLKTVQTDRIQRAPRRRKLGVSTGLCHPDQEREDFAQRFVAKADGERWVDGVAFVDRLDAGKDECELRASRLKGILSG